MPRVPLIVIDFDDVLCQTNAAAAKCRQGHNEVYGTHMVLEDFHYYHWWQNPGWGTQSQAISKAQMFYASLDFLEATPVPGAVEAMHTLTAMGFRLAILTARSIELREQTTAWVDKWLPDVIECIHFVEVFATTKASCGESMERRLSKGEICRELSASLLVDDSVESVLGCMSTPTGQTPALLFGDYEWGKRFSAAETAEDKMSFNQRQQCELTLGRSPEWWRQDKVELPDGIWRVKDWPEVLLWLQRSGKEVLNTQHV